MSSIPSTVEGESPDTDELEVGESPREQADKLYEMGVSDGLPIVPPTPDRLAAVLGSNRVQADVSMGRMPPRYGEVRADALAINSIMAGCRAEHFPVLVAMVQAVLSEPFNLLGVQTTTHPCACIAVVNGPIRQSLKMNLASNSMGDHNQASATLGRALRFALRNIGGAIPGVTDLTTQGTSARSGLVFAESEEVSPFPSFHTTRGLSKDESAVTVFASESPHNVNDHASNTGEGFLHMLAGTMATFGANDLARTRSYPLIALGPEHADMCARDGYTRESIQAFLFEHARVDPQRLPREMREWLEAREDVDHSVWNEKGIPIAHGPEQFSIVVSGGPGKHSSFMPSFGYSVPITKKINNEDVIACDC